ncbi:recombinase family protein [Novosphingobium terrae]|uniref:recombinase family protein n=1 Tax=Novosphingobium terrae TaxID=2726189 RepID=UPI00197DD26B|nr:recombinase family protein [Novosphingobium terrae]
MANRIALLFETTSGPSRDIQLDALEEMTDVQITITNLSRTHLLKLLRRAGKSVEAGDSLIFYSITCCGASSPDLIRFLAEWRALGVDVSFLSEGTVIQGSTGNKPDVLTLLNRHCRFMVAEKNAQIAAEGGPNGRPKKLTEDQRPDINAMLEKPGATIDTVAKTLGVGRSTLYLFLSKAKDRKE